MLMWALSDDSGELPFCGVADGAAATADHRNWPHLCPLLRRTPALRYLRDLRRVRDLSEVRGPPSYSCGFVISQGSCSVPWGSK